MQQILTPELIDSLTKLISLGILVVLVLGYRAGVAWLRKNTNLTITEQQESEGERVIRDAVALIDAETRKLAREKLPLLSADEKQHQALVAARQMASNGLAQWSDDIARKKIDAQVERVKQASIPPPPSVPIK